jgi:hypothetical protein
MRSGSNLMTGLAIARVAFPVCHVPHEFEWLTVLHGVTFVRSLAGQFIIRLRSVLGLITVQQFPQEFHCPCFRSLGDFFLIPGLCADQVFKVARHRYLSLVVWIVFLGLSDVVNPLLMPRLPSGLSSIGIIPLAEHFLLITALGHAVRLPALSLISARTAFLTAASISGVTPVAAGDGIVPHSPHASIDSDMMRFSPVCGSVTLLFTAPVSHPSSFSENTRPHRSHIRTELMKTASRYIPAMHAIDPVALSSASPTVVVVQQAIPTQQAVSDPLLESHTIRNIVHQHQTTASGEHAQQPADPQYSRKR